MGERKRQRPREGRYFTNNTAAVNTSVIHCLHVMLSSSDEKGPYYFHVKSGTAQRNPPSPDKYHTSHSSSEVFILTTQLYMSVIIVYISGSWGGVRCHQGSIEVKTAGQNFTFKWIVFIKYRFSVF